MPWDFIRDSVYPWFSGCNQLFAVVKFQVPFFENMLYGSQVIHQNLRLSDERIRFGKNARRAGCL